MVKIYTSPSCSSCRKVKKWFYDQGIPFIEKNIFVAVLKDEELKDMLTKSENGTEDIISTRSKIIKESGVDINSMSLNELIAFIKANPSILKRPIIIDDNKMQVGYDLDDITAFIPAEKKKILWSCSKHDCPEFNSCGSADNNQNSATN